MTTLDHQTQVKLNAAMAGLYAYCKLLHDAGYDPQTSLDAVFDEVNRLAERDARMETVK